MTCEECKKWKKIAETNINDLRKFVDQDKELKVNLEKIFTAIVKEPVEKPKTLYEYKDESMTARELARWYECMELMYHFAKRYEEQERGSCCSVDRAYAKYLIPECKKLLEHLEKNGFKLEQQVK